MKIDGAPSIQLMESADKVGVHHYGFVTDDVEVPAGATYSRAILRASAADSRIVATPFDF
jgi:hypothetical protein